MTGRQTNDKYRVTVHVIQDVEKIHENFNLIKYFLLGYCHA